MAEIQNGVAKIFGLGSTALVGGFPITMDTLDWEKKWKKQQSLDQNGETETIFASEIEYMLTINFSAKGATRAAAILIANQLMDLAPNTVVEITANDLSPINGKYLFDSGSQVKMARDKEVSMTMKLAVPKENRVSLTSGSVVG